MVDVIHLAHGVGRLFESPIPVPLYLAAASAAVIGSFLVQAIAVRRMRPYFVADLGSPRAAAAFGHGFRLVGLVAAFVTLVFAFVDPHPGFTVAPLLFWTGLIVGVTIVSSLVGGSWERGDPWMALEDLSGPRPERGLHPPWWLGPAALYLLFWLELASGWGFHPVAIVVALIAYTMFTLYARRRYGHAFRDVDPLWILFGFAARIAPLVVRDEGFTVRDPAAGLHEPRGMPRSLFASVFVLMAATTLDNIRETVWWGNTLQRTGLIDAPGMAVDSVALGLFIVPFVAAFGAAVAVATRWSRGGIAELGPRYGWSLIPIGIAYVLAHNMPLLISGAPQAIRLILQSFGFDVFGGYSPSPALIWGLEIALIVGGHILGIRAAHRVALETTTSHAAAMRAHVALAALMSGLTAGTLWLLSLPLVSG